MSKTYKVDGMTCQGCANSVSNAIKGVAPDVDVIVDLDAKQVSVNGTADAALIAQAVDSAGFDFGGVV